MFGGKQKRAKAGVADLVFFEKIFRSIWARVVAMIGITSTRSIFEHARAEAALRYPILLRLRIREDGVSFTALKESKEDRAHLVEAVWAFLEVFTKVLAELSGELLSREVVSLIEKQDKGATFSHLLYRTGLRF